MRLRPVKVCLTVLAAAGALLVSTSYPLARQNVPATISASVTDEKGGPVRDLGIDELTVEFDGRPVAVTAVEPHVGAYDIVVLYADSLMGRSSTSRANDIVQALLREAPAEHRIGFLNTSGEPPRHVPPTLDRELVRRSLRGLLGQASVAGPVMWSHEPTIEAIGRLELLARDVRREPGAAPRAILLIADTLLMTSAPVAGAAGPQAILQWWRARLEFRAADVPLYTVSTRMARDSVQASVVFEALAGETGGVALPWTPDRKRQVRALLDDLGLRLRLTLDMPVSALTEEATLRITTTRPGATVRYARWDTPS